MFSTTKQHESAPMTMPAIAPPLGLEPDAADTVEEPLMPDTSTSKFVMFLKSMPSTRGPCNEIEVYFLLTPQQLQSTLQLQVPGQLLHRAATMPPGVCANDGAAGGAHAASVQCAARCAYGVWE